MHASFRLLTPTHHAEQARRDEVELNELQSEADSSSRELEKQLAAVQRDSDRLGDMARNIERYSTDGQEQSLKDATTHAARRAQDVEDKKKEEKGFTVRREKLTVRLHRIVTRMLARPARFLTTTTTTTG